MAERRLNRRLFMYEGMATLGWLSACAYEDGEIFVDAADAQPPNTPVFEGQSADVDAGDEPAPDAWEPDSSIAETDAGEVGPPLYDLPDRPNIILILADDLGYADLGCYGQQEIATPEIDRLAREGVLFTDCYAGAPVCAPSRSVLMTGQHAGHTRVRGNKAEAGDPGPDRRVPLLEEDVTVAELLKERGYVTGITGKWGLGEEGTSGVPGLQGFDEWLGFLNQEEAHSYYPETIWQDDERIVLEGNLDGAQGEYVHDRFTDFALDFIRRHRERPFFLYLPYTLPHANYEPPDLEPYADEPWSQRERAYAAMVGRLDRDVGRIKARLDELGIGRNSLLIFASDNGAALCFEGVFDSCGPLRGRKRDLYEGGIRVPMIVCMPGHVPQGRTSALPCSFADIFPTLAEAAGVMPPDGLDGVSILPTFLGREQDLGERLLYWEFHENGFEQAGRIGSWKAVVHAEGQPELYDLATDVGETTDLAAENPDLVALFQSLLADAHVESPWWPTK